MKTLESNISGRDNGNSRVKFSLPGMLSLLIAGNERG
jgi:hypothetical protein